MDKYILLSIVWVLYFSLHSVLASNKVKTAVKIKIGAKYKFYRISFNIISTLFLALILLGQFSIPPQYIYTANIYTNILGVSLFLAGIIAMNFAIKTFNTQEFLGIQQLNKTTEIENTKSLHLTTTGFYALVRHPLYFATLLLIIGAFIFMPSIANLIFTAIVIIYLPIGVYFEEKKLIEEFGQDYLQYQKEVKAVIPYIF